MGVSKLIGKTIKSIEVADYDQYGDGEQVGEMYKFETTDGEELYFLCEGGDCPHYGTLAEIEEKDSKGMPFLYEDGIFMGKFKDIKEYEKDLKDNF